MEESIDPTGRIAPESEKLLFQKTGTTMSLQNKSEMFGNRLSKVYRHLQKQAKRQGISCYRIYDHDIPEYPFSIDLYEGRLYVAEYGRRLGLGRETHGEWLNAALKVMESILKVPQDMIFVRQRRRKPGRLGQYQKINEEGEFFMVEEDGLRFKVNLTDYLDTGLFLDHRITRHMVRAEAKDRKVLNLFAYTGSFSVYAAAGGAASVTTVDLSKTYLTWAEENMRLNGFPDKQKYSYVQADIKQYLQDLKASQFDLVVMDPPTFSNSKRMKDDFLDIQRDHVELINHALFSMNTGGILYFSTNFSKFVLDRELIETKFIQDIGKATTPFDFQGKLKRYCWRITKAQ